MATTIAQEDARVDTRREGVTRAVAEGDGQRTGPRLTSEQVWEALTKRSFAIFSCVTPSGKRRSSGVVYNTVGQRLYVAVAPDSWKAKHVAASGQAAVTVPVRRGGILSLVTAIPPATISFHGTAIVHSVDSPRVRSVWKELARPRVSHCKQQDLEVLPSARGRDDSHGEALMWQNYAILPVTAPSPGTATLWVAAGAKLFDDGALDLAGALLLGRYDFPQEEVWSVTRSVAAGSVQEDQEIAELIAGLGENLPRALEAFLDLAAQKQ